MDPPVPPAGVQETNRWAWSMLPYPSRISASSFEHIVRKIRRSRRSTSLRGNLLQYLVIYTTYGSLVFGGGLGNPRATFSYKSGGSPQSLRRRCCTSVNGDSSAYVCPLNSTTLTLIVFIAASSNSALGRPVLRPG